MLTLSRSHRTGRRANRTAAATAARSATLLSGEHRCCSLRAVQFSKCFLCQRRVRFITDFPPVKRVSSLAVGRKRRSDISRAVNAGLRTAVRKHKRDLRAAHIHCGTSIVYVTPWMVSVSPAATASGAETVIGSVAKPVSRIVRPSITAVTVLGVTVAISSAS